MILTASLLSAVGAHAHEEEVDEEVVVTGRSTSLIGVASSASQGFIGQDDLAARPTLRVGELLEAIPGAAVTQHSGPGKANQYFLRGFNLDHGTDFAGFVDGIPLNLPTHGHGQGYLDLNPIIPELVQTVDFGKGPYYADIGDFSSAGYARYNLKDSLAAPVIEATVGEFGFYRAVLAGSKQFAGDANILGALELEQYDGPWELDNDAQKLNAFARISGHVGDTFLSLSGSVYAADWNSTDQVPARAIEQGLISPLGNIDPTLGGESERYSLNFEFAGDPPNGGGFRGNAYAVASDFELFSNFTYFLDDPENGDQITQRDRRLIVGGNFEYEFTNELFGRPWTTRVGTQLRHDEIYDVALLRSQARNPISTVREDEGSQTNIGVYADTTIELTPWMRTTLGLRANQYWFDIDESNIAANVGDESDGLVQPKATLVFGPFRETEIYLNAGEAFHSNDARGTVTRIDPASGEPADPVTPLVQSRGAEIGVRTAIIPGLQSTLAVWWLELDSELLFVGDAGTTEPSGSSRRVGVEWSNFYRINEFLTFDADIAFTDSEFDNGDEIPGSVGRVITSGFSFDLPSGPFGGIYFRHFGDSPLTEDGSVMADSTSVVNLRAGYRRQRFEVAVDAFNLFDSNDPDISYFFASCLPTDPQAVCGVGSSGEGVEDVHIHQVEPRQLRATFTLRF
ncbi:MAG: TonB-dependent receptor [Pseudomonadota bacterium]